MPTVSIVIPTYNRAHLIIESLESVFAQTYTDYEVIIVDDGSTDETENTLAEYVEKTPAAQGRIHFFKQKNAGPAIARNRGIFYAKGEYIAFLDSDDQWYPTKLEKQVKILDEDQEIGVVYTDCYCGESRNDPNQTGFLANVNPPSGDIFDRMVKNNLFWTPSLLFRKEVFLTSGVFDPTLRVTEDYDLWLRICRYNKCCFIPKILTFVREHPERITKNYNLEEYSCQAAELQIVRWQKDLDVNKQFREKTALRYNNLARKFRKVGDFEGAIRCLGKVRTYGRRSFKLYLMIFLLRFVPFIFRWYDARNKD